jgi:small subunit ribosomal protein S11
MSEDKESTPAPEENEAATEPAEESSSEQPEAKAEEAQEKPAAKEKAAAKTEEKPEPKSDVGEGVPTADGSQEEAKPLKKEETAEDLLKSELAEVKIRRAKGSKNITHGIVHVMATFNNTKVNITDMKGNTISWSSSGKCNFRGSRKSTAYAAQVVTTDAGRVAMSHGLKEVVVKVCGPGMGRDSAVRALQSLGLAITSIVDVTPVPHNGCRPPKRRRV